MGWLSSWLRELIMIVLLATFVDMLLPNRSMERYVKLVLSLLILLTLLSPITKLLRSDPVGELKRAMTAMDSPADGNVTLEQILAQGRRLQSNEQEQSLQWTARELANVMKGQIEETTGERVQSVEVQLVMSNLQTSTEASSAVDLPVIERVMVEMSSPGSIKQNDSEQQDEAVNSSPVFESENGTGPNAPSTSPKPIEIGQVQVPEVQIEVRKERDNPDAANEGSPDQDEANGAESEPVNGASGGSHQEEQSSSRSERAVQIITLLTEKWDIDATKVQVMEQKNAEAL
ncbi:stage III sporulation protein AF [Paenibacillus xylanilyticus]|uniref:Stage III sporulation protein AF n=1 Tax=Paenibacillus xylanilyticus TaxID=248903 RepID=A0A7Y6BWF3_9BACL|nr:stage III sporulation protein AF [Paenibacillus xylanilyticus]NUU75843.1 stage III sporulation protein AF [Paenibacillus xylanilyticus]